MILFDNMSQVTYFEKAVFVGDFHIPYHDKILLFLLYDFLDFFKPDKLFILGDLLDCYSLSSFDKNPKRIASLQDELDEANEVLDKLCALVKDVELFLGNHEARLSKHLKRHPELYGLKALEWENLLKLNERGIKLHRYSEPPYLYHGLQIHHGTAIRKHSGWTAKAHYEKYGGCGIIGHVHRGGNYLKRNTQGIWGWYENMCMCRLDPEYQDFVDWIQGFSVAYFTEKDLFHLEQIPVIDHRFIFNGVYFSRDGRD